MRIHRRFVACSIMGIASLCLLVGCRQDVVPATATTEPTADQAQDSPAAEAIADDASSAEQAPAEAEMDYGSWLKLPADVESRLASVYPSLVKSAIANDPQGLTTLAMMSQQIAMSLARAGKNEDVYPFLMQSGRALRQASPEALAKTPPMAVQNIFFNEACALSRVGQIAEAKVALDDAFSHGFTNLASVESDEDLAGVRASAGFAEQFEQWQATVMEKAREHARSELASGEAFPFSLTGTSVAGEAIDLEALKGKVVIVDFWGTWCPPCRAEIPSFIKLVEKFGEQDFAMLGLNYERKASDEENLAAVTEYIQQAGINYPCMMGTKEIMNQVPSFQGYPTTLFIDKTGKVRLKAVGLHDYAYLEAVVGLLSEE